jgi:hypothetical protein
MSKFPVLTRDEMVQIINSQESVRAKLERYIKIYNEDVDYNIILRPWQQEHDRIEKEINKLSQYANIQHDLVSETYKEIDRLKNQLTVHNQIKPTLPELLSTEPREYGHIISVVNKYNDIMREISKKSVCDQRVSITTEAQRDTYEELENILKGLGFSVKRSLYSRWEDDFSSKCNEYYDLKISV